jgi:hypothetical protein
MKLHNERFNESSTEKKKTIMCIDSNVPWFTDVR